ncbi:MAG: hypothetical protein J3K34DRAFT_497083 [Monoraphidium minutum]|nr:MAG: hypothetical protein J3K34DRAFT_497083 [Monoraphidium minutum]
MHPDRPARSPRPSGPAERPRTVAEAARPAFRPPGRAAAAARAAAMDQPPPDEHNELEAEMDRLQRCIAMLQKSNKARAATRRRGERGTAGRAELKDAMQEGPDPEYKLAVDENAKYKARVWALQEELRRLRGMRGAGVHEPLDSIRQGQQPPTAAPAAGGDVEMEDGAGGGGAAAAAAAAGQQQQAGPVGGGGGADGGGDGVWL